MEKIKKLNEFFKLNEDGEGGGSGDGGSASDGGGSGSGTAFVNLNQNGCGNIISAQSSKNSGNLWQNSDSTVGGPDRAAYDQGDHFGWKGDKFDKKKDKKDNKVKNKKPKFITKFSQWVTGPKNQ